MSTKPKGVLGGTTLDLLAGWPNPGLLPASALLQTAPRVLTDPSVHTPSLGYGADEGYLPLRKSIAKWLTVFYSEQHDIGHDRIVISGGASQNLACILQTYTDPVYTRNVWMVAPTYFLACRIMEDSGFAGRLRAVPEDEQGIDIDFLRRNIMDSEESAIKAGNLEPKLKRPRPWRKIYKQIIYAVPTFANPSGKVMTLQRRQQLVKLAREFDALIVTDDVYDMLQWQAQPESPASSPTTAYVPRIVDVDRYYDGGPIDDFGNAVSNGSFSKIVAPGCRTGWAEGTEKLAYGISQTGSTRSGGAPSQLVASMIHQMIESGSLSKHISTVLLPAYQQRYHILRQAIHTHLVPLGVTMLQPSQAIAGGYFIWLTLPKKLLAEEICKKARKDGDVIVIPGTGFQVQGDEDNPEMQFSRNLRLCIAWENVDLLEEAVIRLAGVIKRSL